MRINTSRRACHYLRLSHKQINNLTRQLLPFIGEKISVLLANLFFICIKIERLKLPDAGERVAFMKQSQAGMHAIFFPILPKTLHCPYNC